MPTIEIKHKTKWWKVLLIVSAAAVVAAGATAGICYAVFHKTNTTPVSDKITFNNYQAAMTSGNQTITATSSQNKPITYTASGSGQGTAWTFDENTHTLNYETVTSQTTVTITADDTITTNSINIDLLPEVETSFSVSCTNTTGPNLVFNTADTLSLTWTSANFTPTTFSLKSDGSSNTNWTLTNNGNHQLTLARQSQTLAVGQYPVTIVASDAANNTNEATVVVTVSNPVEKDLFFTTGDTTTTPNSKKAFYGTISASNFTLCDDSDLQVKVNGTISTGTNKWTAITFDNKTHIKIQPPNTLTDGSKIQVAIYDSQNDITSNAIGFSVQSKMNVDDGYYVAIKNDGTVSKTLISSSTVSLNSKSPALVGLYFGKDSTVTTLYCGSNQLTSLDVSGCTNLNYLDCASNQLTQLDVSNNSQLTTLSCYSNPLNLIKLPTNKTTGTFTFASSGTSSWTATGYAITGNIYCNSGVTINGWPTSGWTRHNS